MNKESENELLTCKKKLKELVNKNELYFTKRCNKSIDVAITLALSKLDSTKEKFLFIQEEGGWLTYKNYAKKHKMTLISLKMDKGKILDVDLQKAIMESEGNAILIMHSLPGYSYSENMEKIEKIIGDKNKNMVLINDCCGSIGSNSAKIGDILVCSFGEAKPLSAGGGGFIAASKFSKFSSIENNGLINDSLRDVEEETIKLNIINFKKLNSRIDSLKERVDAWHKKAKEVKKELIKKGFSILNEEEGGVNVLAQFSDEGEKERLINYCKENNIEYTECPRYIRTNKKALSLEIKRLDL